MLDKECVHCFSHNHQYFVVDGNSGSVHLLDELAYQMIKAIKDGLEFDETAVINHLSNEYSPRKIKEAFEEITVLVKENLLFSPDFTEIPKEIDSVVKALCLNVAHDCNLRCKYCFAQTGDFGGKRELMSYAVAKKAVDFLINASKNRHQLELDFFGGEPLLNFEVVKKTVLYGEEQAKKHNKNIRFTITTNGIGLTKAIQDFLNEKMYNVVLSIDGRREVNDAVRQTINGEGSVHDVIVPKYQEFVKARKGKQYYVRGTFTKNNLDFCEDVLYLAGLGFDQISMEPVVADSALDYALTEAELPTIFHEYHRLADELLEYYQTKKSFNFFHFNVELKKGPCLYKRIAGCGAGHEYIAVTPTGELYPCHQFIGDEKYKIGDVWQGIIRPELGERLKHAHVLNKPTCRKCWAKYYCSGGCHFNNLKYGGSLSDPYLLACEMERKRLECSLYIYSSLNN